MTENESKPQGGALAGNSMIVAALVMTCAQIETRPSTTAHATDRAGGLPPRSPSPLSIPLSPGEW